MHWDVVAAGLTGLAVGAVLGAIGIAAWWARQLSKPETVQKTLRDVYARAHPHWLQVGEEDPTRICPTCGWSEKRGAMARALVIAEEQGIAKTIRPT